MTLIKIDWSPDSRKLRVFGAGFVIIGIAMAGAAWHKGHLTLAREIIAGLFAAAGALTLAVPAAGRPVYAAWMGVAFVIGTIVSNAALFVLYFGVITPMGLAMRLFGKDALRLKRPAGDTYWTEFKMPEDPGYYERLS